MAMTYGKNDSILETGLMLGSLCIYRGLLRDPVIGKYYSLLKYVSDSFGNRTKSGNFINLYTGFYNCLASFYKNTDFRGYLIEKIIFDENPFTSQAGIAGRSRLSIPEPAVRNDLKALQKAAILSSLEIKDAYIKNSRVDSLYKASISRLPDWNDSSIKTGEIPDTCPEASAAAGLLIAADDWGECYETLKSFHETYGCGIFARYKAFIWRRSNGFGRLAPVRNLDPVMLTDLIDYEVERFEVVKNTEHFLDGHPANNVLLYGDRGTGKSSTVKAILNEYHSRGLRVIEVPKNLLVDFPEIVSDLSLRNHKFILFVDDLAFEDNEENFTALKAVLEGSLEARPRNVLIYATSNRRHLIKEKFSDRAGLQFGDRDDEVRAYDTMQEKLSLSDRFGITIVFSSPDKERYLHIIEELAERNGILMDRDELHREALKWELWYNGRSPRTAQQFITWLKGCTAD
ncbi:MAG: ATP-binding protein [Ruminiclostridium sp.]|nr:ATP-binding protein [Ruminiclostridium sp.]